jgi:hypothetical protein
MPTLTGIQCGLETTGQGNLGRLNRDIWLLHPWGDIVGNGRSLSCEENFSSE